MRMIAAALVVCTSAGGMASAADAEAPAFAPLSGSIRPAESGKPFALALPAPTPPTAADGCAAWDCRLRVIGAAPGNGAFELSTPLLRW